MNGPWDVVIAGAGPAGLAAALYTGRARLSTAVLERGMPGGQILLTDWVENYPGFPSGVAPFELMQGFRKQAETFGAGIVLDEALSIATSATGFILKGHSGEYEARSVIVATGSAYRRLGVEGEERLTGRGVSYCAVCDGAFFAGRDIAVVGGGDNALKEALFLTKFAKTLTLIHRRATFRGERIYQERVAANDKIRIRYDTIVCGVMGETKVEAISLIDLKSGATSSLPVAGLFVSIGTRPQTDFVKGFLELNEWGQIKVGRDTQTSVPGIFAAGDVCDACPKQIATAVGSGVHAALSVQEYLARQPAADS
ncbi:MAG: thioredoxin-disulfide reductase [Candidatus Aminicenantes bacterium RBG_16_66_30]|nr:MAG: thioredoxin-disulfide reductase [Candidatus Aminicenantes bacterium RBG_16_66_30]